ncbi:phosphatidylinositol-specific phospholipase C/glycerophosphodiester phosphodiesterase family protein [Bacillus sp. USDA818B3_A]|uniref:phosphatidylinositol-specific phospholipase C/glycerophosphodiester phosphodiesterase family protein n=1 Tax=Bacillus sp. USDA818B3_A TaxID=2698834 RepID=UPI0013710E7D|nr:phosphatidylinositol-specific phospholipase C/glycerophosphodiester phosphodiesterase family protein [Bacillus sp. USDA818B3_A]
MKNIIKTALIMSIILTMTGFGKETLNKNAGAKENGEKTAEKSVLADLPPVIHGLGWIDGYYVTNSFEAFKYNYKRGFRVFEVDLNMTSDNYLVARHDWTLVHYGWLGQNVPAGTMDEDPLTFDQVMSLKIHGQYHPVSWKQLLKLMRKYPDIYFVTDTKETDEEAIRKTFSYLVRETKKVDPKLLDRIIPQIYSQPMLSYINSYHRFKYIIYTLYKHTNDNIPTPKELAEFCVSHHVTAVNGLPFRLTVELQETLHENNIIIYTHTINKPKDAAAYLEKGIGIYTDYLYYDGKKFIAP